jgi:hypothetical protein
LDIEVRKNLGTKIADLEERIAGTSISADRKAELKKKSNTILEFCSHLTEPFVPLITTQESFNNKFLACQLGTEKFSVLDQIYWGEIDQRFYCYKTCVHKILEKQIASAIEQIEETTVLSFLLRQVIEITIDAIANQWLMSSYYNIIKRDIVGKSETSVVTFEELENFVISLTAWPSESVEYLTKIGDLGFQIDYPPVKAVKPTTDQQFCVAEYVAEGFDDNASAEIVYKPLIEHLKQMYAFFCGFVHPGPRLYPLEHIHDKSIIPFTSSQVNDMLSICMIDTLDSCLKLINGLFFDKTFATVDFQKLFSNRPRKNSEKFSSGNITDDIISDYVKRNKSLALDTSQGLINIWKKPGGDYSKRTLRVAKKFDSLDEGSKKIVTEFINSLIAKQ